MSVADLNLKHLSRVIYIARPSSTHTHTFPQHLIMLRKGVKKHEAKEKDRQIRRTDGNLRVAVPRRTVMTVRRVVLWANEARFPVSFGSCFSSPRPRSRQIEATDANSPSALLCSHTYEANSADGKKLRLRNAAPPSRASYLRTERRAVG